MAPQSVPCSAGTLHATHSAGSSKRALAGQAPEADVEADIGLPEVFQRCGAYQQKIHEKSWIFYEF